MLINMFEREVSREKNIEQILKKKAIVVVVDNKGELKLEKNINERIKKIDQNYIPFINNLFNKSEMG